MVTQFGCVLLIDWFWKEFSQSFVTKICIAPVKDCCSGALATPSRPKLFSLMLAYNISPLIKESVWTLEAQKRARSRARGQSMIRRGSV